MTKARDIASLLPEGVLNPPGGKLKFPATQSASSDANTLDDYEEGTWTPTITFGSGSATTTSAGGKYIKIGNQVTVNFIFTFGSASNGANPLVSGLPFSQAQAIYNSSGVIREWSQTGLFWALSYGSGTSVSMQRYDNNNVIPNGTPGFAGTYTYITS